MKESKESDWLRWYDRTIAGIPLPQGMLMVGDCENANLSSVYDGLSEFQAPVAGFLVPKLVDKSGSSIKGGPSSEPCHLSTVIFNGNSLWVLELGMVGKMWV
jgi:hypothetical protein